MEEFIRNGNDEGNFLYGIQFKSGDWSNPNSIPTVLGWFQIFFSHEVAPEHLSIAPSSFDRLNPNKDYALRPLSSPRWEMMRNQKSAFGLKGWLTTLLFQRWPKTGPRTGQSPYYMIEAFLEIQHLINLSFMEMHSTQDCFHEPEVERINRK